MSEKDLRKKIAKAEGPDRELDALIWAVTEGHKVEYDGPTEGTSEVWAIGEACTYSLGWRDDGKHTKHFIPNHPVDHYTASIDAAVALIERKLPGWGFSVTTKAGWSWACINEPDAKVEIVRGEAKTPALALIAALLSALETHNG